MNRHLAMAGFRLWRGGTRGFGLRTFSQTKARTGAADRAARASSSWRWNRRRPGAPVSLGGRRRRAPDVIPRSYDVMIRLTVGAAVRPVTARVRDPRAEPRQLTRVQLAGRKLGTVTLFFWRRRKIGSLSPILLPPQGHWSLPGRAAATHASVTPGRVASIRARATRQRARGFPQPLQLASPGDRVARAIRLSPGGSHASSA